MFRTVSVVLYECQTWSLSLKKLKCLETKYSWTYVDLRRVKQLRNSGY
jgi:hypothetical protein